MPNKFGTYVRDLRKQQGLSLTTTARLIGVSKAFLSRCETETCGWVPSEPVIRVLAMTLGADFDMLMHLAGRIPEDVEHYILSDVSVVKALRLQNLLDAKYASTRHDRMEHVL